VNALKAAALIATSAALMLTACTSTPGTGTPSTTPGGTGTTSDNDTGESTSAEGLSSSPGAPASTANSVNPNWCTAAQVSVAGGPLPGGSAAGHTGVLLTFTNHSTRRCTLTGYPGVAGLNTSGAQIAQATRTLNGYLAGCRCTSAPSVSLAPGAIASAVTEGNVGGSGNCDAFSSLLVTPPNTATSTRVDLVPHSCGFTIHPVVAGSTGSG
jgi:hypothetical protein